MNAWDILIVTAVALLVFFAVRSYRKHGKSCCNSCESCSMCNSCEKKK